jgi:transposase InsO family protein
MEISKQSFHQKVDREMHLLEEQGQLLPIIKELREEHPAMSSKVMYRLIRPGFMGRDRFIAFCNENGFKIEQRRSYHRTTNSLGVTRFDNLITGRELTGFNQIWVSDITYYRIGETFYYITFIMDLFSRYIVGYSVSDNLMTAFTTMPALEMALKHRQFNEELILHSDGGGQYYCKDFLVVTRANNIRNSMCKSVYENPHAERVNGTIKNDYLYYYAPRNLTQLCQATKRAVANYNGTKPHQALKGYSPLQFENLIQQHI